MNQYILDEMEKLGADGVDLVDLSSTILDTPHILASYTKDEIASTAALPRAGKIYWKIVRGKKKIICK